MRRSPIPSERELRLGLGEATQAEPDTPSEAVPAAASGGRSLGREVLAMFWPPGYVGRPAGYSLLILAGAGILTAADFQIFFALASVIQAEFGGVQFLAIAYSVNQLVILLVLVTGFLADRWSRVWMLRVGGLMSAVGTVLVGLSGSPLAAIGAKTLSTSGSFGVVLPAQAPLVADYVAPESRGKAYGFQTMAASLAAIFVPVGIGALGLAYGWRLAFLLVGAASFPPVLLYFLLKEPPRGEQDRIALGITEAIPPPPPVSFAESFRRAARVTTLRWLWLAQVLVSAAAFANLIAITYYSVIFHLNVFQYSLVLSAQGAALLVAQLVVGPLTDRLMRNPPRVMVFLAGLALFLAASLAVLTVAPSLAIALPASILSSVAFYLLSPAYSPVLGALLSLTIPPRIRGFGMQSIQPWSVVTPVILAAVFAFMGPGLGLRQQFLFFIPFYLAGGLVYLLAMGGVGRDIRSALAAAAAEQRTRGAREAGAARLLVVRDLDLRIGGAQILFGTDFEVGEGEIVALLGTNGAGKSSLLKAIAGLEPVTGGAIFFDDVDVTYTPAHQRARQGLAMVAGGRAVFANLTVAENLALAGRDSRAALDLFPGLRPRLGTRAGDLSGGEQQMVCLAQALMERPRLLLVDELTLGLAPRVVEELLEAVRRARDAGTTIVLVEQSVNLALTIADRVVFMEKGEVRFEGKAEDLLRRGDLVRAAFLGSARGVGRLGGERVAPAAEEESEVVLEADNLTLSYGGVLALDGVSLRVRAGEVVGFIGPNGAGKSTLFDVLSGFAQANAGSVAFLGRDVTGLGPDARARAGLMRSFQSVRLFPALTVRESIAVAFERHIGRQPAALNALWFPARATERRLDRRIDSLIQGLGLLPYQDKFVGELSTGTRRIVDLACLRLAEPRLLLLDEPSSGLAQAETEELGPVIGRIAKETGCAVMIIEHDVELARSVSGRMYALDRGRVIAEGTPDEVLGHPDVIQSYLAGSEAALRRSGLAANVEVSA